jgi:hypothetical protein
MLPYKNSVLLLIRYEKKGYNSIDKCLTSVYRWCAFNFDFSLLSTQSGQNNKPPAMRVVGKRVIPKNHLSM